jgi:hypothetical protein
LLWGDAEGFAMSKEEAIFRYKAAMSVFKNWLSEGAISEDDLLAIDTMLAQKYGLSSCSIFLENDLLCKEKRVIYGSAKGGHYGQKDN